MKILIVYFKELKKEDLNEYAEEHERLHIIDMSEVNVDGSEKKSEKMSDEICYKISEKIWSLVNSCI